MDQPTGRKRLVLNEVKPKRFPTELLQKDWSKRRCLIDGSQEYHDEVFDYPLRDDDVWVVTLAKCGTTWMQELAWLIMHDYDFDKAKQLPQELRSPYFEFGQYYAFDDGGRFNHMNEAISPRVIKTHFPLPLLPQQIWQRKHKLIYVARDPRDALVSAYHIYKKFGLYGDKSLNEVLLEIIVKQRETNAHFQHMLEFYQLRHESWIFYTSFERMKTNLEQVILDVSQFLGKTIENEQMQQMLHHLSFEEMQKNPMCSHEYEINMVSKKYNLPQIDYGFIRKGQIGDFKEQVSSEVLKELNEWIESSLKPYNVTLNELLLKRVIDGSQEYHDEVFDYPLRDDDVWVVILPKCGTTWMQELAWLIMHDYDFDKAKQLPQDLRSPYFELSSENFLWYENLSNLRISNRFGQFYDFGDGGRFKHMNEATSPRVIKTHLPLPLLPQQIWQRKHKLIYVARDPRDALVSAYHIYKKFVLYGISSLNEVLLDIIAKQRETNAHFQHMLEFYQLRHQPWIFYTSFERMKTNLEQVILDVSKFLGKTIDKEQMQQMLHHLSFEEMKKNPQCNHEKELNKISKQYNLPPMDYGFIRKGQVGDYKEQVSSEVIKELNEWIESSLKPYDVSLNELLLKN